MHFFYKKVVNLFTKMINSFIIIYESDYIYLIDLRGKNYE